MIRIIKSSLTLLVLFALTHPATAQTAVYHLHKENSTTSGLFQLKSAGPDAASTAMVSGNLNGAGTGEYAVAGFDTQAGDPTYSGTIASGKTVTFALYMRKTANLGAMVPRAKLYLNSSSGTPFCTATGTTGLTTTITKYTFSCTTTAAITFTSTDRIYLWVGINLTTASSGGTFQGELDLEGTLNGLYDSQVTVPAPAATISSLSPTSGPVGTVITVTGSNFGVTQGSSALKLGVGTISTTAWSATQITATIPTGSTTNSITVTVGGVASNGTTFTVLPTPNITSASPNIGAIGTLVTLAGTNFGSTQGSSTVTFNGVNATPSTWSSTQIKAPVPSGATTGNIVVTVNGVPSNNVGFTLTPVISGISPTTGAVGTSVTVSGSYFQATQGSSTVKFAGTVATPTSWSDTQVIAPVPSGATTGNVQVIVNNGFSNGVTFTVVPAPNITSLSQSSGSIGTSIMVNGTNFGTTQGSSTITFNGTAASPTSWSQTQIIAPVPSGSTTGNVVVTVSGVASTGVAFTVAPNISSLSPSSGGIGTSVTVSGTNFGATQGSSTIKFNATPATPSSWSSTQIVVPVPAGATTGNVVVTVGSLASNGSSFTVYPTPTITNLSPNPGPVGTLVTITGTTFGATQSTSVVTFNGTAATPSSWSGSQIQAPVPAGATTGNVVVTVNGVASSGAAFTVPPNIASLSPGSGAVGTPVTIIGTSFGGSQGASTVQFNGTATTPTSWSDTEINAPVPSGAMSGNVVVTVNGIASSGATFTLVQPPAVNSVSPTSGVVGTSVTITGSNFGSTEGTSGVTFNGTAAVPTSWNDTQIVTAVPISATGPVVVTVNGASSNMTVVFTVTSSASGTHTSTHLGFDSACVPTTNQMQAWWDHSPYFDVGVYIGGANASCVNVTPSWVTTVTSQGWGIIPIYVGAQAPGTSFHTKFDSNPSVAYSQGAAEASDAISKASNLGLGNVIYKDLEQYNCGDCASAVANFVSGWVDELKSNGYAAGLYANPTNFSRDIATASSLPDYIWLPLYDGRVTIWGISPLDDNGWTHNQRMKQFDQFVTGVKATFGGVSLDIDVDIEATLVTGGTGIKSYTFVPADVGFPDADLSYAEGIEDDQVIVGTYGFANQASYGYTFNVPVSGYNSINNPYGADLFAYGINNLLEVVGTYDTGSYPNYSYHGFLYDGLNFIGFDFPGALDTQATGINDAGQIVGVYDDSSTGHGFSVLYDRGLHAIVPSTFATVDCPGASGTRLDGINGQGEAVGSYYDGARTHGFLYNKFSTPPCTTIDSEFQETELYGINNNGEIAGHYQSTTDWSIPPSSGFVYNGINFFEVSGPTGKPSIAFGLNDWAWVVGCWIDFFYEGQDLPACDGAFLNQNTNIGP